MLRLRELRGGFTSNVLQNLIYGAFLRWYYPITQVRNSFHTGCHHCCQLRSCI